MNKENIATARYNMSFNNGSFKKGKHYKYQCVDDNKIYVTTEENREQDFFFSEFDTLFYFDNNN